MKVEIAETLSIIYIYEKKISFDNYVFVICRISLLLMVIIFYYNENKNNYIKKQNNK